MGKLKKCKKLEELFQVTVILTISVINRNYRFPELYGFQALHIHKKSSESRKEICKRRIDAATVRYILYLFGQGYFIFIREKSRNFETDIFGKWQSNCFDQFRLSNEPIKSHRGSSAASKREKMLLLRKGREICSQ